MRARSSTLERPVTVDLSGADATVVGRRSWPMRRIAGARHRLAASPAYRWLSSCEFGEPVERMLRAVVMIGLLLTAVLTAVAAVTALIISTLHKEFASSVPAWLNSTLLIFIVLELVQTVRQQIDAKERLSRTLVCNFLAFGVLSSVRHLLGIGAEMSLLSHDPKTMSASDAVARQGQLVELAVTAVIVLVLVACWWIAGGLGPSNLRRTRSKERSARKRGLPSISEIAPTTELEQSPAGTKGQGLWLSGG